MDIQDLGSIGELVAAIATVVTLGYLAVQVRQNTRALKASTFQSISSEMGQNVMPMLMSPDMGTIFAKSIEDPDGLDLAEQLKVRAMYLASLRRLEAAFVHAELGSISHEFVNGFDLSIVSIINTPLGKAWWASARSVFYPPFVNHVDTLLASGKLAGGNPAVQLNT